MKTTCEEMEIANLIVLSLLIFFCTYALYKEYKEHDEAFTLNKAKENDTLWSSLRKLEKCLDYDKKTIKWRRILLSTVLCITLLFIILHKRLPTTKEFIIYLFFIFIVFYVNWNQYCKRTASGAVFYGLENIKNIKKLLIETRSFIFPWKLD
jgi:hypothetical protein